MTFKEAEEIFKSWQEYMEIADKLHQFFTVVPESFLPYPIETLEEALNIIAKFRFDSGDKHTANNIKETMAAYLGGYYLKTVNGKLTASTQSLTDEEVLLKMKANLDILTQHPELKKVKIENLKRSRDSWLKFREKNKK